MSLNRPLDKCLSRVNLFRVPAKSQPLTSCSRIVRAAKWQRMSNAGTPATTVRLERAELSRLAWAFAISIAAHLFFYGAYEGGKRAVAWMEIHHPDWLKSLRALPELARKPQEIQPPKESQPPLMFVDVNPAAAIAEPPPDAKFESDKNSRAANIEPDKESDVPKITGKQEVMVKTEDIPRQPEPIRKLQPALPAPPKQEEQTELKAKRTFEPGDLHVGKPDPNPKIDTGDAPKPRPRTLREARARETDQRIPGVAMKQEGGVKRRLEIASLDVKATLFGAYENGLVAAISQRWWDLLDERNWAADNRGKVVVRFNLHYDGTITGVKISENTTGAEVLGYVCVKAIQDPAPYSEWPTDMRHEIASGVLEVQFTFFY
jgi:outer membrane biosynthesis protein TonB